MGLIHGNMRPTRCEVEEEITCIHYLNPTDSYLVDSNTQPRWIQMADEKTFPPPSRRGVGAGESQQELPVKWDLYHLGNATLGGKYIA